MAGQTKETDEKLDKVFVSLPCDTSHGMLTLEWALDHFDGDKTKIFLVTTSESIRFWNIAKKYYLPRCTRKNFSVEIQGRSAETSFIYDFISKVGMRKLVIGATCWNGQKLSESSSEMPINLCKIWIVNEDNGKLNQVRYTKTIFRKSATQKDMEELLQRENDLHRQAIEHSSFKLNTSLLFKENEQLKLEGQRLTNKFEEANKQNQDLQISLQSVKEQHDSIQSRYDKLQVERDKLEEERNKRKQERDKLQEKLIGAAQEKNQLQSKNQYLSEQKLELEKLLSDSELDRKDLQANLATLQDRFDSLQSEYVKLFAEQNNVLKEGYKLKKQRQNMAPSSEFTLQELKHATQNFSDSLQIGKGGYGSVYKGSLRGTDVAIKILNSHNTKAFAGFQQEVAILSVVRHPNLVTLLGACHDASALVYKFLPNGSLENHLNRSNNTIIPLTWKVRTRILGEICLALIFLHSNKPNLVIHGDLKPDNVLLDANFASKLSDFGISRFVKQSGSGSDTTAVYLTEHPVGTRGYIDPEFLTTGELMAKSDVYSFGIMILRLLTRKHALNIAKEVQEAIQSDKTFKKVIDVSAKKWPLDHAKELAWLGLRCAQMNRRDRPDLFSEVWPIVEKLQRRS